MSDVKALLVVDVQRDFCPGGALAVPKGDEVVPVLNQYIRIFFEKRFPVFASRDWHPEDSKHFKKFGGLWPVHCVRDTPGAAFHAGLELPAQTIVLSKGTKQGEDGYSVFEGADAQGRAFPDLLKRLAVKELYVGGLATDYCVKSSVLDARKNGLTTFLLTDAIRGIKSSDSEQAIRDMQGQGVHLLRIEDSFPSKVRRE